MCCGILRAVGAQFYSSVIMFFSFYVIGASTGLILLLKSTLQVYGISNRILNFQIDIFLINTNLFLINTKVFILEYFLLN